MSFWDGMTNFASASAQINDAFALLHSIRDELKRGNDLQEENNRLLSEIREKIADKKE